MNIVVLVLFVIQAYSFSGEGMILYALNTKSIQVYVNSALIDSPILVLNTPYSIAYNFKPLDFIEIHLMSTLSNYVEGEFGINASIYFIDIFDNQIEKKTGSGWDCDYYEAITVPSVNTVHSELANLGGLGPANWIWTQNKIPSTICHTSLDNTKWKVTYEVLVDDILLDITIGDYHYHDGSAPYYTRTAAITVDGSFQIIFVGKDGTNIVSSSNGCFLIGVFTLTDPCGVQVVIRTTLNGDWICDGSLAVKPYSVNATPGNLQYSTKIWKNISYGTASCIYSKPPISSCEYQA